MKQTDRYTARTVHIDHISRSSSQSEKSCRQNVVENIRTHILYSITFFPIIVPFLEIMWENMAIAGQATFDSMADAICALDT
jgi:hypothetical protein